MTNEQLNAIEARANAAHDIFDWETVCGEDVPSLIAEVRRLQTELDRIYSLALSITTAG